MVNVSQQQSRKHKEAEEIQKGEKRRNGKWEKKIKIQAGKAREKARAKQRSSQLA
jgi:hypothetical protein